MIDFEIALYILGVVIIGVLLLIIVFQFFSLKKTMRAENEPRRQFEVKAEQRLQDIITSRDIVRQEIEQNFKSFRNEILEMDKRNADSVLKSFSQINLLLGDGRKEQTGSLDKIRETMEKSILGLRDENSKKLDEMRQVVDEKLQTTLEKRIGESFKLVGERLESVYKSLGEMQNIASSVGDLKRVLTNVKTRGTFGEVQLGRLLEDMLTSDQFERNVKPNPRSNDIVEFAIKLPGNIENDSSPVYLPIDSKFPMDEYERIVEYFEKADFENAEIASSKLGKAIESYAKDIRDKYIKVPFTTNFAILFLPTEGLYAEVLRKPGLAEKIQRNDRILIAGPTTLAALLNSLQVGFQTLVIQKNSAEIEKTLNSVRSEFEKFGEILKKVSKKLAEAQNSIEDTEKRHRIAMGKLSKVKSLEADKIQVLESSISE